MLISEIINFGAASVVTSTAVRRDWRPIESSMGIEMVKSLENIPIEGLSPTLNGVIWWASWTCPRISCIFFGGHKSKTSGGGLDHHIKYASGMNKGFVSYASFSEVSDDLTTMLTVPPSKQHTQLVGEHLYSLTQARSCCERYQNASGNGLLRVTDFHSFNSPQSLQL